MSAGVVEFLGPTFYVETLRGGSADSQVALLTGLIEGTCELCPAHGHPPQFAIRNRPVNGLFGAVPRSESGRAAVFVDPRCLGLPVKVVLHEPGLVGVASFLHAAGVETPSVSDLEVVGSVRSRPFSRDIELLPGDVVVLTFRARAVEGTGRAACSPSQDGSGGNGAPREDDSRKGPVRWSPEGVRNVRRRQGFSHVGGCPGDGERRQPCGQFPDVLHKLDQPRLIGGVEVATRQGLVQQAIRNAGLLDLQVQLVESFWNRAAVVYNEAPPPHPRADDVPQAALNAGGSQGRTSEPSEPDIKRVRIKIVCFQGPERCEFLWTEQGEDVAGLVDILGVWFSCLSIPSLKERRWFCCASRLGGWTARAFLA